MITEMAVHQALKAKKSDEEKKPSVYSATSAGAQLEQQAEGGLRDKPNLKVKADGAGEYLEAEDDDLDVLTDAVHGALVSYYKRKKGYCQCTKYLLFIVIFIIVVFMEAHVEEGAYTHGVAHNFKETLFPDFAGDNIGFPGGRIPNRVSGWTSVYSFFSDSVSAHFPDPRVGDTLCTGPVEFPLWGGFGSADCGKSTANISKVTITASLTPELMDPLQTNLVCPPEARDFFISEDTEFDFEKKKFTVFSSKSATDTTTPGGALTWSPVVGYTIVIGSTFSSAQMDIIHEKIPSLKKGATYYIATVDFRSDLMASKCLDGGKARRRMNSERKSTTKTTRRRMKEDPSVRQKSGPVSDLELLGKTTRKAVRRRQLLMMGGSGDSYGDPYGGDSYGDSYGDPSYSDNGQSSAGGRGCMNDGMACMINAECCSGSCDMGIYMCASSAIGGNDDGHSGRGGTSGGTSGTADTDETASTEPCFYAYDISLVTEATFLADKSGKKEWRQSKNTLEVGCNFTYWNITNNSPAPGPAPGSPGPAPGSPGPAPGSPGPAPAPAGKAFGESCSANGDCASSVCHLDDNNVLKCDCHRPNAGLVGNAGASGLTCSANANCCSNDCDTVAGTCRRGVSLPNGQGTVPCSDGSMDCISGICGSGDSKCLCRADEEFDTGSAPSGRVGDECCSRNAVSAMGDRCKPCIQNGMPSDDELRCCSRTLNSEQTMCAAGRRRFLSSFSEEFLKDMSSSKTSVPRQDRHLSTCTWKNEMCSESNECCDGLMCVGAMCIKDWQGQRCPKGSPGEAMGFRLSGESCVSSEGYLEMDACCDAWCDPGSGLCAMEPPGGGCHKLPIGEYCYNDMECCSDTCDTSGTGRCIVKPPPVVVVIEPYVKACNGTSVGIFPETALGVISGVRGLSATATCTIDRDRPLLAEASYNLCARDPYTLGADTTRCIFNNGRGQTKDISIGGTVRSSKIIKQTVSVDAVDGEWMLLTTDMKNAKLDVNVTWVDPSGNKQTVSQISNLCKQTQRSFLYTLEEGPGGVEACDALKGAFGTRSATVCADVKCADATKSHHIFNFNKNGSHFHYFPSSDATRERYFRGTANKMIAGVLVSQHRFKERNCRPEDTRAHDALFSGSSSAKCIDDKEIGVDNTNPFGADPIYLSSSAMFDEVESQTVRNIYNRTEYKGEKYPKTGEWSDYNKGGTPYGFKTSNNEYLAKKFGHAVLYQNNLKAKDAAKLTNFLREGFYLDALTKDITVTYLTFNAYDMSYHKFNAIFKLEFPTGGIQVEYDHMSFTTDPYFKNEILWLVQVLYWMLVFLTALEEIKEMLHACSAGTSYFNDGWNYPEVICVALQMINFVIWWVLMGMRANFKPREQYVVYPLQTYKNGGMLHGRNETAFDEMLSMYDQAEAITDLLDIYEMIQTIVLFFILLRWFKQLDFHPEFGVITRTCAQSWKSLSQWLVVFLVVQVVFIMGGYYSFGQTVQEFATIQDTIFVQYQLLNGDLSVLASLWGTNNKSVNPVSSYVYVFVYYMIVFIVMLNVLLGIIIDAYTDQRDRSAEDPLTPDESPWEEMRTFFYSELRELCVDAFVCGGKRKVTVSPMVEIQSDPSGLSDEEAEEVNNRARLSAQLREILSGALAVGRGSTLHDAGGRRIQNKKPNWGSDYYTLDYTKPVEMVVTKQNLLRTSRGDLTHEELKELLHYQFVRFSIDEDKSKSLSNKIAELAIWRYGKMLNVESRREIGVEHRNVMNEHRFNRLEEQIAFIAESGTQQWGSVQTALQTVAVSASQYTGPPAGVMTSVVNPSAQATMVVGQTVDHVNL